jgi:spore coat polysaccharide biosynthesis protein SpsF
MRTVAVVQARLGSSRLPRKVLEPIAGRPMVAHVLDRASRIEGVDEVAAAIPDIADDDPLDSVIRGLGFPVVRGSGPDVLSRFILAADATSADVVVRVTADCPLLSPQVSGRVMAAFAEGGVAYASNTLERTYPRGLDTEVVAVDALRTAAKAADEVEREHVTPFVHRRPETFALRSVVAEDGRDLSAHRWTVDTAADLAFVRRVYAELEPDASFEWEAVIELLERQPEIGLLNRGVAQKQLGQ